MSYSGCMSHPASLHVFGVTRSILGQPWRWSGGVADGLNLTDIETQLYLSSACPAHDLERHRAPTIRPWTPEPAFFCYMDTALMRTGDVVACVEHNRDMGVYDSG